MRGLRWFGVVAALVMLAAACTGDEGGGEDGSGGTEPTTLEFWYYDEGYGFLGTLVKRFEAATPNVDIDVTTIPEGQYGVKLDTALAAGEPPDIGLVNTELMNRGVLLPVDDIVEAQGIDLSTYNQAIVGDRLNAESCAFEGKLYCLGSYTGSVQVFYNKDMFDAAGIPYPEPWPPMTVDEFVDTACELTDPANEVWGAAYGDPVTWMPWEMVASEDGRTATGYVNGPTSVHVHEVLARGIQDGCAPSLNILDPWEQGTDFFARGQLAMVVTDFQSLVKIESKNIEYGVTAPATPEGVEPFFNVWTDSIGVFADTDQAEAAKQFISFLATDGQRLRVELTGDMPLDTAVAEDLNWADDVEGRHEALTILPHARPPVLIPNRFDVYGPIFDAFGLIVSGQESAQAALDEAAPKIQDNLDKSWEVWEGA